MTIGQKIKELRISKKLTQKDVADDAGISYQHLSTLERGNFTPHVSTLLKIAKALNVPLKSLL